ncbi:MAG: fumarate hydratase [Firmicutes bacterium]|nr:fumarate hydratase [Bacillota bacterium]
MREIDVKLVQEAVKSMCIEANHFLGDDVKARIHQCMCEETSELAKEILGKLEENMKIAEEGVFPLCQDTGMACIFMEIGQDVHFTGGLLADAVNAGVRDAYVDGYLRKSVVGDPLERKNTGDNTPADLYTEIVEGDKVKITVAPKGFGSENMSQVKMFPPSAGRQGVEDFIVKVCSDAGANPCPPVVVGVGIGGNFSRAAVNAKKALLKPFDEPNSDPYYDEMEKVLLDRINDLGIGPQGTGGKTTALKVNIIAAPTHIAGLPVAVNINCHVSRHKERIL